MMHNADTGYDRYAADWEPGRDEFQGFSQTVFRSFLYEESRHIFDTLAVFVGATSSSLRFPRLRSAWSRTGAPGRLRPLDSSTASTRRCRGRFDEHPSARCAATCGSTRSTRTTCCYLVDALGAERVLFGSDFPHPEGLGDPLEFVDQLAGLPEAVSSASWAPTCRTCSASTPPAADPLRLPAGAGTPPSG